LLDLPGKTLNPFDGIYAAISQQAPEGNPSGGWYPEQQLMLDEALGGYPHTLESPRVTDGAVTNRVMDLRLLLEGDRSTNRHIYLLVPWPSAMGYALAARAVGLHIAITK
jgi:hypothetical protein